MPLGLGVACRAAQPAALQVLAQVVALLEAASTCGAAVSLGGTVHVVGVHPVGLGRSKALQAGAALVRLARA